MGGGDQKGRTRPKGGQPTLASPEAAEGAGDPPAHSRHPPRRCPRCRATSASTPQTHWHAMRCWRCGWSGSRRRTTSALRSWARWRAAWGPRARRAWKSWCISICRYFTPRPAPSRASCRTATASRPVAPPRPAPRAQRPPAAFAPCAGEDAGGRRRGGACRRRHRLRVLALEQPPSSGRKRSPRLRRPAGAPLLGAPHPQACVSLV